MKKLLLTFLCFHNIIGFSQATNDCDTLFAFLNESIDSTTFVYYTAIGNKPNFAIANPNDEFYQISLLKKRFKRYYVQIENLSADDSCIWHGWINRTSAGIGFAYDDIEIFEKPREKSDSNKLKIQHESVIATILDYKNSWIKISFYLGNSLYIGWIPKKYQCSNAFTMCCGS